MVDDKNFTLNDILKLKKFRAFDLMRKSIYEGLKLDTDVYHTHDNERKLFITLMEKEKFKNVRIDNNLIGLIMLTDNDIFKRQLFYTAFFVDNDFDFGRFLVKGLFIFGCNTIKRIYNGKEKIVEIKIDEGIINDIRVHFCVIDKKKNDVTNFGVGFADFGNYSVYHSLLPEYVDEKETIKELLDNVLRITCNIIDMIEGNKEELDIKTIVPTISQNEKRMERGDALIPTTVIIKPKKELINYLDNFEKEYKRAGYSHKFVVRGHWRHYRSEYYKGMFGQKTWIKPFIKGQGIFIKKDALVRT